MTIFFDGVLAAACSHKHRMPCGRHIFFSVGSLIHGKFTQLWEKIVTVKFWRIRKLLPFRSEKGMGIFFTTRKWTRKVIFWKEKVAIKHTNQDRPSKIIPLLERSCAKRYILWLEQEKKNQNLFNQDKVQTQRNT